MSMNTGNTPAFIHTEQYGGKKKKKVTNPFKHLQTKPKPRSKK
tara:strand:+ start:768 stop:896 length:129 start_codon:yes stop_codon:yes gene_type:complete